MGIAIEEIPEYRKNRLREYISLAKLVKNSDENQKTSLGLRVSDYNDSYNTRTRIRARIEDIDPVILSRMFGLSEVQEGVLALALRIAKDKGMPVIDLKDLRTLLNYVGENRRTTALLTPRI